MRLEKRWRATRAGKSSRPFAPLTTARREWEEETRGTRNCPTSTRGVVNCDVHFCSWEQGLRQSRHFLQEFHVQGAGNCRRKRQDKVEQAVHMFSFKVHQVDRPPGQRREGEATRLTQGGPHHTASGTLINSRTLTTVSSHISVYWNLLTERGTAALCWRKEIQWFAWGTLKVRRETRCWMGHVLTGGRQQFAGNYAALDLHMVYVGVLVLVQSELHHTSSTLLTVTAPTEGQNRALYHELPRPKWNFGNQVVLQLKVHICQKCV